MKALVVANGDLLDRSYVETVASMHDLIIATDGAANSLSELVTPHIVCGDFDSIDRDLLRAGEAGVEYVHTPDQEMADLEKAIVLARDRGASDLTIVGALGSRLDHSLSALSIILRYHSELRMVLVHGGTRAVMLSLEGAIPNPWIFDATAGDLVSVIPHTPAIRIELSNVQWPLSNEIVRAGSRGVSNRALGGPVSARVTEGIVMLCHTPTALQLPMQNP